MTPREISTSEIAEIIVSERSTLQASFTPSPAAILRLGTAAWRFRRDWTIRSILLKTIRKIFMSQNLVEVRTVFAGLTPRESFPQSLEPVLLTPPEIGALPQQRVLMYRSQSF